MRNERILEQRKFKLMQWVDGPFQVLDRSNDNAVKLDLQCEYNINSSFNFFDLIPFKVGELDLRSNHFQPEGMI